MHKYLLFLGLMLSTPIMAMTNLPEFNGGVNPNAMWKMPQDVQIICNNSTSAGDYQTCLLTAMQKAKASAQAMAIMRYSLGVITDYKKFGSITVVHVAVPAADHSDAYYIITNTGDLIDIDDSSILSTIDISKANNFQAIAARYPNISIWPGNHQYPTSTVLPGNINQLVFSYSLLNGCMACELGGTARVAFNFAADGTLQGTQLLGLDPAPVVSQ